VLGSDPARSYQKFIFLLNHRSLPEGFNMLRQNHPVRIGWHAACRHKVYHRPQKNPPVFFGHPMGAPSVKAWGSSFRDCLLLYPIGEQQIFLSCRRNDTSTNNSQISSGVKALFAPVRASVQTFPQPCEQSTTRPLVHSNSGQTRSVRNSSISVSAYQYTEDISLFAFDLEPYVSQQPIFPALLVFTR